MKLLFVILFLLASLTGRAQSKMMDVVKIPLNGILKHLSQNVIIVDSIYNGKVFNGYTLLNIGGNDSDLIVSVFIDKKDYKNFDGDILDLYLHKKITVSGQVSESNNKAQIIVTDPKKQINLYLNWERGVYLIF